MNVFDASHKNAAVAMFCLGMSAMLAQLVMTRELMVAFYGNELAIGIIFSAWLLLAGGGSLAIRPFLRRLGPNALRSMLACCLAATAAFLPLMIFAARAARIVLNVPAGEYMSLAQMAAASFAVLAPIGLAVGAAFPCACGIRPHGQNPVATIYAAESAGSMAAGMLFSFLLVTFLPPLGIAGVAALCAACGACAVVPRAGARAAFAAIALAMAGCVLAPQSFDALEEAGIRLRWQSFGILPRGGGTDAGQTRLLASRDSRHQNLAVIATTGQMAMYSNGQVVFVFPDAPAAEHKIHFIMAQNPSAGAVLLIGGNPVDDIPELLKYPLRRLVHLELDPAVREMLASLHMNKRECHPRDPRLELRLGDATRFAAQTDDKFDIIIVEAPGPSTIAMNRFYTVEFYRGIRRILAPGGFFTTALDSSEDLLDETAGVASSIRRALQVVFPRVLATFGPRIRFFAGGRDAPVTFDAEILCHRSSSSGIATGYFRPEYFLNADEISTAKTQFVCERLDGITVPANTALRPVSAFYDLWLWSRYSGSELERVLRFLRDVKIEWAGGMVAAVFLLLIASTVALRCRKSAASVARAESLVLAAVIAGSGFAGMALELMLIFIYQSLIGYVYASLGMLAAMFMMGLIAGAVCGRLCAGASRARPAACLLGADLALSALALLLPDLMQQGWGLERHVATLIYSAAFLAGWAPGAQFVAANMLLGTGARGAALLNAVDLAGAALGGMITGVVLLPLFGIAGTCYLLAALKAGTLVLAGLFLLSGPGTGMVPAISAPQR